MRFINIFWYWWGRNKFWNKNGFYYVKWGVKNVFYKLKNDKVLREDIVCFEFRKEKIWVDYVYICIKILE